VRLLQPFRIFSSIDLGFLGLCLDTSRFVCLLVDCWQKWVVVVFFFFFFSNNPAKCCCVEDDAFVPFVVSMKGKE
jgi:hypothetical protein